jgi:hypothetical protein
MSYSDIGIGLSEVPWYAPFFAALLAARRWHGREGPRGWRRRSVTTVGFLVAMLYVVIARRTFC